MDLNQLTDPDVLTAWRWTREVTDNAVLWHSPCGGYEIRKGDNTGTYWQARTSDGAPIGTIVGWPCIHFARRACCQHTFLTEYGRFRPETREALKSAAELYRSSRCDPDSDGLATDGIAEVEPHLRTAMGYSLDGSILAAAHRFGYSRGSALQMRDQIRDAVPLPLVLRL